MTHDDALVKLTETGARVLRDDTQFDDETRLMLEVAARLPGGFTEEELVTLMEDIAEKFDDDFSAALTALKSGELLILTNDAEQEL